MLFLTIFGKVMLQFIKINWKCVFILIEFAHGTDVWKLAFFGLYIYVKSLKTVPSGLAAIEIIFTRPLTIYNSSEPINSALFSKAKPLRSPWLVSLNSFNFDQERCNTSKGFRAPFVYCIWTQNDSFLSVFSKAAFLSFTFFLQILNYVS